MNKKKFPNGFTSWMETHHEVVSFITGVVTIRANDDNVIRRRMDSQGTGGLYELAEEWTDEFEKLHEGQQWDGNGGLGEWMEVVEEFLNNKNNEASQDS